MRCICTYEKNVVSSNICLPTAFPRSYVRSMQPILQSARTIYKKIRLRLVVALYLHYHEQASHSEIK